MAGIKLEIQLLGGFRLIYCDRPYARVSRPRLQELLAYILLHRHTPISRPQLAYLFWPESTDSQARTNLRKALYLLRDSMPEFERYVAVDANHVQWRPELTYALDVAQFQLAIEHADAAGTRAAERRFLEDALVLYQGPLLPDCYEEWIIPYRAQLQARGRQARLRLIQLYESEGSVDKAIQETQLLLQRDPLEEQACRLLMRLWATSGDRRRALQAYQDFASNLEQEVGALPAPATRQLYMQIRADSAPAAPPIPAAEPDTPPLIGRRAEWSMLHRAWRAGNSVLISIQGEAGIGKTHLAEAFLASARQRGIKTAAAHCYEGGELAFEPVIYWLRTPRFRADLTLLDGATLREVSRLLPELSANPETSEQGAPNAEPWQRQRLFESLARALLAGDEPVLLLLDDLQWSDLETLEWLQYLLRFPEGPAVVVLCTLRTEGLAGDHPVKHLERRLQRHDKFIPIQLARLDAEASGALAQSIFGNEIAREDLLQLYAETEGSPLLIVETVRAAQESPGATSITIDPLTPKVQAIIESRLARLSQAAQDLAATAAVIGRAFTLDILEVAAQNSGEPLVAALDELTGHQVVAERRKADEDEYYFTHDKIRQVTYERLTVARQRLLHRRVAEALERAFAGREEQVSGQVGRHFERARLFPRALTYYERAARQARGLYAYQDAERLYARAIAMATRLNQPGEQLIQLYQQRGRMLEHAGRFEEAISVYRDLERLARSRWDRRMECVAVTHLADCYVKPDVGHNRLEAKILIERGLQLALDVDAPAQHAHLLWSKMVHATHYGHTEAAQAAGKACVALCREHGLTRRLALALHDLGLNLRLNGDLAQGDQFAQEARALFRQMDNQPLLADSLNQQALFDYLQHRLDSALQRADEAATISRRIANKWNRAFAIWIRAMVHDARGSWGDALSTYEESLHTGLETGFLMAGTVIPIQLGLLHLELGAVEEARRLHENALEASRERAAFVLRAALAARALTAFKNGNAARGVDWLRQAQRAQALGDITTALLLPLLPQASVLAAERDGDSPAWQEAHDVVQAALAEARKRRFLLHELPLRYYLGIVLQAQGQVEAAAVCWRQTLEQAQRLNLRPLTLALSGALYRLYSADGQTDTALPYAELARATLADITNRLAKSEQRSHVLREAERRFGLRW